MSSDLTNTGEGNEPVRTRALIYGTAPIGSVSLHLGSSTVTVPVSSGQSPAQVAQALVTAVNTATNLVAAEIRAVPLETTNAGFAEIAFENVLEEEILLEVVASGTYSFGLLTSRDWPEMNAQSQGGDLVLSWPQNPHPFVVESGTALGPGFSWQPLTGPAQWTTNAGRISLQLPKAALSGFYRLVLRPPGGVN